MTSRILFFNNGLLPFYVNGVRFSFLCKIWDINSKVLRTRYPKASLVNTTSVSDIAILKIHPRTITSIFLVSHLNTINTLPRCPQFVKHFQNKIYTAFIKLNNPLSFRFHTNQTTMPGS